ncbi:MAG: LptF/LptG family permease [Prevotella sp.]|nr:LptF/LptG family permease [Prevotella sp.]MCH3970693.1 LptF/LptG family permease [Prevotella sp.]MCH3984933.1 LptF/LptG family permease [Prevotella sp.]MCH3991499.1 LptF/LptG family permease [Prevotella sp.]MCH4018679.1 LptF/LptG family permease [Prevotella sp.]MCH4100168.1 LptF/LptG family permease [Prevotella sp.]
MPRIKKLDIFIIRQFGLLFLGTFFICQFVLMMQFLWRYIDDLIGKGLTLDVMAQFFWYMGLMLVPQALPLAILLSSLITFGNLGESSELTAIKASGISLLQAFKGLIVVTSIIMCGSFYFQNYIGPHANMKIMQLLISMKQKSPELEIPEGVFYDGIPQCNIYVQKKNVKTGKLYGVMIYRMTDSYEDAAIILADSGMIQSTAEKKHLVLSLWSGEWFENMQESELQNSAAVPYRRESFIAKKIIIDFNGNFNMTDASSLSNNAQGKSLSQIHNDIDSLNHVYDSVGTSYYRDARMMYYSIPHLDRRDSTQATREALSKTVNIDSLYNKLTPPQKQSVINNAMGKVQNDMNDLEFKSMITSDGDKIIRLHEIESINKFTLALTCLIFFFIGAPLGAIIRKGGLGVPVIVSVFVFIFYYILDNTGYRMARQGIWSVWFGKALAPAVLIPIAIFVTYKANNDSVVFNLDLYRDLFRKILGLRVKREVSGKEVIIQDPDYRQDSKVLNQISQIISVYDKRQHLRRAPNPIKVFFKYHTDHTIEKVNEQLEQTIEDLSNTRDNVILTELNHYPVLSVKAHTRPFEHLWMNVLAGIFLPAGLFLYFRMWRFRLRLMNDLKTIQSINRNIEKEIITIETAKETAPDPEGEV